MEGNEEKLLSKIGQQKLKGLFDFFQDLMKPKKQNKESTQEQQVETKTVQPLNIMDDKIKQKFYIFQNLTQSQKLCLAREASKRERQTKELNVSSLIYGEMTFPSFAHIFGLIKTQFGGMENDGGVFYDLGSGAGKGVIAASLLHPFERCCGIELLDSLHCMGLELLQIMIERKNKVEQELIEIDHIDGFSLPKIDFLNGDFLNIDWSDASVVFAASTCFDPAMMQKLLQCSKKLQRNTFFITLTKQLPGSEDWQKMISVNHKMSWGETTVHIYKKQTDSKI